MRHMLLLAFTLPACLPSKGGPAKDASTDDTGSGSSDPFVIETIEGHSNRQGVFTERIQVAEDEEVMQIVAEVSGRFYISTEYLTDPDGNTIFDWENWYNHDESLTSAIYPNEFSTTMNWPVREEDGPLDAGEWVFQGATVDGSGQYISQVDYTFRVMKRPDPDFGAGTLRAVVAYAGGLESDEEVVPAIEAGVAYWTQIYAAVGITLEVEYATIDMDPTLPYTNRGADEYQAFMENYPGRRVLMIIGDTIADDPLLFGEAGGIPGPYYASPIGAVEIAWVTHAGRNGTFNEDELGVLGETMAHETGHFLGLFHPVEYKWEWWDALDDTEKCTSMGRCEEDLGDDLMFPYPLCYGTGGCDEQNRLTADQAGVMNRYVGVE